MSVVLPNPNRRSRFLRDNNMFLHSELILVSDYTFVSKRDNTIGNIIHNNASSSNHRPSTDMDSLTNDTASTNPSSFTNLNSTCYCCMRSDVHKIAKFHVMSNRSARIHNAVCTYACTALYNGSLHDNCSFSNNSMR